MKLFYGWKIVGAALGLHFLQAAMLHQAFGAYVATLSDELGWSKTALSAGAALQSIETALLGPALGWTIDRFGARALIRFGVVVFGLGWILFSRIESLTGFYVAVVAIAIGASCCGYFPLAVAVIQWFERKRARALSAMGLGLALGGVFVPVVAWTMQSYGWRVTALASGIIVIVVGLPLSQMFIGKPEDIGQTVDGEPSDADPPAADPSGSNPSAAGPSGADAEPVGRAADSAQADAAAAAAAAAAARAIRRAPREFTTREALRTGAFWLISIGHGLALLAVSSVNVHAINHISTGLHYSIAQASLFITLMTVSQTVGVLLGITFGDRFDKRRIAATCMLMHATGLLMLTYASSPVQLAAFSVLHGVAWGLRGPLMQAIRADYFGRRAIGMILGLSAGFVAIGQVLGPMIAGGLADLTGDYRIGFTLLAVLVASGAAAFMLARRPT
ncbi:MAG: MFS transporter [Burkholderiales bacterium]|nr:MAG: MFS transporter [Burkholderiales bacterium]